MLIWGFFFALPVAFALVVAVGIVYRLSGDNKVVLSAGLTGTLFTYLGTYFLLTTPPSLLLEWLSRYHPLALARLHYLGLRSTNDAPTYVRDVLLVLGWLFGLGCLVGIALLLLVRLGRRTATPSTRGSS